MIFDDLKRKLEYLKETKAKLKEKVGGSDTDTFRELTDKVVKVSPERIEFEGTPEQDQIMTIWGDWAYCEYQGYQASKIIMHDVESIYNGFARYNVWLESVDFGDKVKAIYYDAFDACMNLVIDTIPDSVTEIGTLAFCGCEKIENLTISKNIETIWRRAFYNCTALTEVVFRGTPTEFDETTFENCSALTSIKVPWSEGAVSGAPWGATNATITYDYTEG